MPGLVCSRAEGLDLERTNIHVGVQRVAVLEGKVIEGRLKMSDAKDPVCASVRPPAITWNERPRGPNAVR